MHEKNVASSQQIHQSHRIGDVCLPCLPDNEKTLQLALQGFTTL